MSEKIETNDYILINDKSFDSRINGTIFKVMGIKSRKYQLLIIGFTKDNCFYNSKHNKTRYQKGSSDSLSVFLNFNKINPNPKIHDLDISLME